MKKLLYTTSALVGAAFLMEAVVPAKAEVNMSLRYRAALISQGKNDVDKTTVENSGSQHRSTALNSSKINIDITGEKEHPNGLTTGASLAVATSAKKLDYDNAIGYVSGSFGKVEVGDFHDVGYRALGYGTPGTSNFGAVDAGFNPAGVVINTSATGNIGGRGSSIAYWSPSFSGAQVSISWSPQVAKEGRDSVGHTTKNGDLEDSLGLAATYSGSFGGTGVSMGISYESLSQVSKKVVNYGGKSVYTSTITVGDALTETTKVTGVGGADAVAEGLLAYAKGGDALLGKSPNDFVLWSPDDDKVYLYDTDDSALALPSHDDVVEAKTGGIGGTSGGGDAKKLIDDVGFSTKKQDGSAYAGYLSFDIQNFTVGGSYGSWESPNHAGQSVNTDTTAYALGASYSVDAITFGIGYSVSKADKTFHNIRVNDYTEGGGLHSTPNSDAGGDPTIASLAGGATQKEIEESVPYKKSFKKNILAFTTSYQLGDGATVDFVIEQSEQERLAIRKRDDVLGTLTTKNTGFGIGIDLKF